MERTCLLWAGILAVGLTAAGPVLSAGPSSGPSNPPPPPEILADRAPTPEEVEAMARQDAEEQYAKGRRELEKADAELAEAQKLAGAGDEKSAEKSRKKLESARKQFKKAGDRFREATVSWPQHADAWNLLGYCLRRQDRLEEAFDAYWHCLEIDPEHAAAHEYLGEAWLMAGRLDQAQSELAWLERRQAPQADQLRASIERYRAARPSPAADSTRSAAATGAATSAAPDTTATHP